MATQTQDTLNALSTLISGLSDDLYTELGDAFGSRSAATLAVECVKYAHEYNATEVRHRVDWGEDIDTSDANAIFAHILRGLDLNAGRE